MRGAPIVGPPPPRWQVHPFGDNDHELLSHTRAAAVRPANWEPSDLPVMEASGSRRSLTTGRSVPALRTCQPIVDPGHTG